MRTLIEYINKFNKQFREFFFLDKSKYPSLDGLRAIAIIMVFNVHFLGNFTGVNFFLDENHPLQNVLKVFRSGHLGVDLFFILSGFLIFRSLTSSNPTAVTFFKKRVRRLLPAHILVLLFFALPVFNFASFISNALLLPGFFNNLHSYNYVTWSLSWEILFYVIIFLFYKLYKKINKNFFPLLAITYLEIFIIFTLLQNYASLAVPSWGRFFSFFLGVIIAYLELSNFNLIRKFTKLLTLLTIVSIFGIIYLSYYWVSYGVNSWEFDKFFLIVGLCFAIIVLRLIVINDFFNKIFNFSILRFLGQISYSFYLVHTLIIDTFLSKVLNPAQSFVGMLKNYSVIFIICTLLATFIYYYLERPYFIKKEVVGLKPKNYGI